MMEQMFDFIDATGTARKDDPCMRDVEREMIRSQDRYNLFYRPALRGKEYHVRYFTPKEPMVSPEMLEITIQEMLK